MIIKHVEFKVICDSCYSDITDWHQISKQELRKYAKKEGIKLGDRDKCLCEDCQNKEQDYSST